MKPDRLRSLLGEEHSLAALSSLYGERAADQIPRYRWLLETTTEEYAPEVLRVFSAPGRVELGGNHTDHNGGKVLAASVELDALAMVEPTDDAQIDLHSEGYAESFHIDLRELDKRVSEEGRTEALIRGIAARFQSLGYRIGGFRGALTSAVLPGSGLSSSASVEILVGTIFNHLFNGGAIPITTLALVGQFAENHYFGKPCGLMDQIACASGGVVSIDFQIPDEPAITGVDVKFSDYGLALIVVDTGGSHADLTPDYAAVPEEMRSLARVFDKNVCRELDPEAVLRKLPELRRNVGDRAILRGLHFFADNERVEAQLAALRTGNIARYLEAVRRAGDSSWELLQNNYSPANVRDQGVPLGIVLTRRLLGEECAVRIQGGGFAGTLQAYLPLQRVSEYIRYMERFFGGGCATSVRIRSVGATEIFAT